MQQINRPALRYHGGKWRIAEWIIEQFPPHVAYVEPFGGGGSVLLQKPPASVEVYNDIDGDVANFFRMLRTRSQELIAAIELTPYSRMEHKLSKEPCEDELERARRLYIRMWQSYGSGTAHYSSGWRYQKTDARGSSVYDDWSQVDHLRLITQRLKAVFVECDPAVQVIKRYDAPGTLFYCDPPYVPSSRSERWRYHGYTHEMTEEDHRALAECLHHAKGKVIVSGYDSELYRELFAGWKTLSRDSRTLARGKTNKEFLWVSPNAELTHNQQKLF